MKSDERVLRAAIREMINEDRPRTPIVQVGTAKGTYSPISLPIGKQLGYLAGAKLLSGGFNYFKSGCVNISDFPVAKMKAQADLDSPDKADVQNAAYSDYKELNTWVYKVVINYFIRAEWPSDTSRFDKLDEAKQASVKVLLNDIMQKRCLVFNADTAISSMSTDGTTLMRTEFVEEIKSYLDDNHTIFQGFIERLQSTTPDAYGYLESLAQKENTAYERAKEECK